MHNPEARSAVDAAKSAASALGLRADDAVILHSSNRLAVRLLPCDVLVRVAPATHQAGAQLEVQVTRRLAQTDSPVAMLDPRVEPVVHQRDGFAITFWTYYEPASSGELSPREYAQALGRLHAGMRTIELSAPHFTDRVAEAQRLVGNPSSTPELGDVDRALLSKTLRQLERATARRGSAEQLLHGEPHPGNLLRTKDGLLFVDFETCCRGPVEFDVAHTPEDVSDHYSGADKDLVGECRLLMMAMVAAWRWQRDDQFPDGRGMGTHLLRQIRAVLDP